MKTIAIDMPMTTVHGDRTEPSSIQIGPSLSNDDFVCIQTTAGVMYVTRDDAQKMAHALLAAAISDQHTLLADTNSL